jgi:hypothetical protein
MSPSDSLRQQLAKNATSKGEHDLITIVSPTLMNLMADVRVMVTTAPNTPLP